MDNFENDCVTTQKDVCLEGYTMGAFDYIVQGSK